MRLRYIVFLSIASLLFTHSATAQSPNGTISGTVFDQAGKVVAGADVTIVNDATRIQNYTKTNNDGIYVLPNLTPGSYRLQVAKLGFKTLIKPDISLNVQDALAINFTLPIGAVSETVTVQGGAPLVNTESGSVSTVIGQNLVQNLPLNGRSFNTLLQLTPGVVIPPITNGQTHGQFSIAGQRTDSNNLMVDGVSANFGTSATATLGQSGTGTAQAFSALGSTSSLVSVDALQEFRIETSSFAPEFGKTPGGQIILTTRSGTNDFHGSVFEYFRNTVLDANNWFNNWSIPRLPRAPEHQNDFGGVLGGPISKNKTFFFASYEGARLDAPTTQTVQVPLFGPSVPGCSPSSDVAPFLDAYPKPNGSLTPAACVGNFTGSFANRAVLDAGGIRVDHTFNNRYSIFGRFNDAPSYTVNRIDALSTLETTVVNTRTLTVGLNVTLSSTVVDSLRGNYSTQPASVSDALDTFGGAVPPSPALLIGTLAPAETFAAFTPTDGTQQYTVGPNAHNQTKQANVVNDLSLSRGPHQLKFGVDYRGIVLDANPVQASVDYILFPPPSGVGEIANFIATDVVDLFDVVANRSSRIFSQSTSLYAQDTWKISRKVVLTYGLRWELAPAPGGLGSTTLASWMNVNNPPAITLAPPGTSIWHTTYGNFAPRVGIAYSLNQAGTAALRAAFGIFYDLGVGTAANLATLFPNSAENPIAPQTVPVPANQITSAIPALSASPPFPFATAGIDPNLILPRSYQWNVAFEKSFKGQQAMSATYVGQAGRNLLRKADFFQPNLNFTGVFELTNNSAFSNYNALQVQYRRPLSSLFQVLLNYTYSHSLDNASNDVVAGLSSTVISAVNDYASSDFDVRNSFSGAVTLAPPGIRKTGWSSALTRDWSFDAVVVLRSGFPINAQVIAPSLLGPSSIRPDRVPGQPFYIFGDQCNQVFGPAGNGFLLPGQGCPYGRGLNPSAFDAITPVNESRQGTLGRNAIPGFGLRQVDFSIARKFPLTERFNLQFRADAFNLFNRPNFADPSANPVDAPPSLLSSQTLNKGLSAQGGLNPLFQEGGPRSLQLSLRLAF